MVHLGKVAGMDNKRIDNLDGLEGRTIKLILQGEPVTGVFRGYANKEPSTCSIILEEDGQEKTYEDINVDSDVLLQD
ncbi:hypothetical protein CHEID_00050 [Corynebacterium heidelbergense]|nr:hypothetical protein CHEID_00050 [Corynebacterium heidelbergense]